MSQKEEGKDSIRRGIFIWYFIYLQVYNERHFIIFLWLLGFPCSSAGKESACNAGDPGSVPGLGISPGEGEGTPLQYSGLENCMDCIVHGVAKSQTQLSNFHFFFSDFWRWITIKNYEGSEIIDLVCYGFMDVNRRHENPGSETKDIITHDTANSISWVSTYLCCFHFPLVPRVIWWATAGCCGHDGFVSQLMNTGPALWASDKNCSTPHTSQSSCTRKVSRYTEVRLWSPWPTELLVGLAYCQ